MVRDQVTSLRFYEFPRGIFDKTNCLIRCANQRSQKIFTPTFGSVQPIPGRRPKYPPQLHGSAASSIVCLSYCYYLKVCHEPVVVLHKIKPENHISRRLMTSSVNHELIWLDPGHGGALLPLSNLLSQLQRRTKYHEIIRHIRLHRNNSGRTDCPIEAMVNAFYAMKVLQHRSVSDFLRELGRNGLLMLVLGFRGGSISD